MPLALLATIALGAIPPPALSAAADDLVLRFGAPAEDRRALVLTVEVEAPALAHPLETALAGALGRRGWAVTPVRGDPDPEARARAAGADWLLRVRGGLVPGRPEVALVGEAIPTWPSFFLQRRPGARPVPPRVVQARTAADPETLLLGRPPRPLDAGHLAVRRLARIPGRVLALATGDPTGDGSAAAILAVTSAEVLLLSTQGAILGRRPLDPDLRRPVRSPTATAAIGEYGAGRLAYAVAGAPQGEVLAFRADRLERAGVIAAVPLCAGGAGRLFGAFAPGKGTLADVLSSAVPAVAVPRSGRELLAVAAAPRGGRIAFGALAADYRLELLGPDLALAAPAIEGVGAGFALADLDGDGTAEVVASAAAAGGSDRIRVIAPLAPSPLAFESPPVEGAILAGASGDLTGDGVDDALLAAIVPGEGGAPATDLLLVTADPRELP